MQERKEASESTESKILTGPHFSVVRQKDFFSPQFKLSLDEESKKLFDLGKPGQGYIGLVDLESGKIYLLPSFNMNDGLEHGVGINGHRFKDNEFVTCKVGLGQFGNNVHELGCERIPALNQKHNQYTKSQWGAILGFSIWKEGYSVKFLDKMPTERAALIPDEYIVVKNDVGYQVLYIDNERNAHVLPEIESELNELITLQGSKKQKTFLDGERSEIEKFIEQHHAQNPYHTQLITGFGIKFAKNRSTSQNYHAITYSKEYSRWFHARNQGHTVHSDDLIRELPLDVFQKIMNSVFEGLELPPVNDLLNSHIIPKGVDGIYGHLWLENFWKTEPTQALLEYGLVKAVYELELMANLPMNETNRAQVGKIYLSMNGDYVVRDLNGDVQSGSLKNANIDFTNLAHRLKDPELKKQILAVTSKVGHTLFTNDKTEILNALEKGAHPFRSPILFDFAFEKEDQQLMDLLKEVTANFPNPIDGSNFFKERLKDNIIHRKEKLTDLSFLNFCIQSCNTLCKVDDLNYLISAFILEGDPYLTEFAKNLILDRLKNGADPNSSYTEEETLFGLALASQMDEVIDLILAYDKSGKAALSIETIEDAITSLLDIKNPTEKHIHYLDALLKNYYLDIDFDLETIYMLLMNEKRDDSDSDDDEAPSSYVMLDTIIKKLSEKNNYGLSTFDMIMKIAPGNLSRILDRIQNLPNKEMVLEKIITLLLEKNNNGPETFFVFAKNFPDELRVLFNLINKASNKEILINEIIERLADKNNQNQSGFQLLAENDPATLLLFLYSIHDLSNVKMKETFLNTVVKEIDKDKEIKSSELSDKEGLFALSCHFVNKAIQAHPEELSNYKMRGDLYYQLGILHHHAKSNFNEAKKDYQYFLEQLKIQKKNASPNEPELIKKLQQEINEMRTVIQKIRDQLKEIKKSEAKKEQSEIPLSIHTSEYKPTKSGVRIFDKPVGAAVNDESSEKVNQEVKEQRSPNRK